MPGSRERLAIAHLQNAEMEAFSVHSSRSLWAALMNISIASENFGHAKALLAGRRIPEVKQAGKAISAALDVVAKRFGGSKSGL